MATDLRRTVTARLEEAIRLDVISGLLKPGQKLRLKNLADRYHVSVTPLREALHRLALQGLVVLDAQVGARVADMSLADADDMYQVRLLLEPPAVARSVARGDETWLAKLEKAMDRLRTASLNLDEQTAPDEYDTANESQLAWVSAHRDFHLVLIEACGSQWLRHFIDILHQHADRYRNLARGGGEIMRPVHAEHEELFRAAASRDAQAAADATAEHLRVSIDVLRKIVEP